MKLQRIVVDSVYNFEDKQSRQNKGKRDATFTTLLENLLFPDWKALSLQTFLFNLTCLFDYNNIVCLHLFG